jgi:hypothetical protein
VGGWHRNAPFQDPTIQHYRDLGSSRQLYPTPEQDNQDDRDEATNTDGSAGISPAWIFPCESTAYNNQAPESNDQGMPLEKCSIVLLEDGGGSALVTVPLILVRAIDGLVLPTTRNVQFVVPNARQSSFA